MWNDELLPEHRNNALQAKTDQRRIDAARQIFDKARAELFLSMRYLDLALGSLPVRIQTVMEGIGTDGAMLAVYPKTAADLFTVDERLVCRIYLHCLLHCLFFHPFEAQPVDEELWRIACDVAVENMIDGMDHRCLRTGISRRRANWYDMLRRKRKVLTAQAVYKTLLDMEVTENARTSLREEFCVDVHSLWPSRNQDQPRAEMAMPRDRWQDIGDRTRTSMETFSREQAQGSGDLLKELQARDEQRMNYRDFLRNFAIWREEIRADQDTFDYVFYSYGLRLYGNMPLIEPQEFTEVRKIEEFVVVLDVSMSTSGELIQTFLNQTWQVLTECESYMRKIHLRILQCDDRVRSDKVITGSEELEAYLRDFHLFGGGGTDFRPAFVHVRKLVESGVLTRLRGMIYFTDGHGIYPSVKPPWECAFVFMEEDYTAARVPEWAIRLVVRREEIEEDGMSNGDLPVML